MTITRNLNGTNLEIALEGRLDTMTAPELEAELSASMNNAESLTLDFSKLEYISSAGLRVLLFAHKVMSAKGGMKVLHVNEIVPPLMILPISSVTVAFNWISPFLSFKV